MYIILTEKKHKNHKKLQCIYIMNLTNVPNIPNLTIYTDFLIVVVYALCAYRAYKRGLLKESLTTLIAIPYITLFFYVLNKFFKGDSSFDNLSSALTTFGIGYIIAAIVVFLLCKYVEKRFTFKLSTNYIIANKTSAILLNITRITYTIILCLILSSLHINDSTYFKDSKILSRFYPVAQKAQNFLLSNGYIANEIVLYEYKEEKTPLPWDINNNNPIIQKIQNSGIQDKIKEMIKM